ncbi:MAG: alpha/beta hydrolase [Pseudomonadota bacterium]|nr:alpha/beta hydrolase [Pseudomonadota bacterium]
MEQLNVLRREAASGVARRLVVLCHGVAADAQDLIGLAEPWAAVLPDLAFVAVDAPEVCDMAPFGRQWFSLQDRNPAVLEAGAKRAGPALMATVDAELARLGLAAGDVVLMGFSQGAMLVLHAGLRRAVPPAAILAYSGALLESPALDAEMTGRPQVLLVHGEEDEVVPFERGQAAAAALRRRNVPVTTVWRKGVGHWVDEGGLQAGAALLAGL